MFSSAIGQVMTQVRPRSSRPHNGDVDKCFQVLYPIAVKVFNIKDARVRKTNGYIKKIISEDSYSFEDCVKYPEVMAHHIQKGIGEGKPVDSYPTNKEYDATDAITNYKSEDTRPHPELRFLRFAPVTAAVTELTNRGCYPVKVKAHDMPNNQEFDNFDVVLRTFHAIYCDLEGLERTSDMATMVLSYLYHGHWTWMTKNSKKMLTKRIKPIIFYFHKKMIGGRSRFTAKVIVGYACIVSNDL